FRLLPRQTITGLGGRPSQDWEVRQLPVRPSQDWEADHHRTGRQTSSPETGGDALRPLASERRSSAPDAEAPSADSADNTSLREGDSGDIRGVQLFQETFPPVPESFGSPGTRGKEHLNFPEDFVLYLPTNALDWD
ncbi:unnamed protein product, partial [Gadus morhua 'NCC']